MWDFWEIVGSRFEKVILQLLAQFGRYSAVPEAGIAPKTLYNVHTMRGFNGFTLDLCTSEGNT